MSKAHTITLCISRAHITLLVLCHYKCTCVDYICAITACHKAMPEKVQNTCMLAPHAFGGSGPKTGPDIFMTDDDFGQRGALLDTWKEVIILLCTFHFLQTIWRWLYNSSNNINRDDHQQLMGHFQKLVRTPPSSSRIYITMQLIWLPQNIPIVTKSMKKDL